MISQLSTAQNKNTLARTITSQNIEIIIHSHGISCYSVTETFNLILLCAVLGNE
jgi:hypothetical protein